MCNDYEQGLLAGLRAAARICDETAAKLDQATRECEAEGDDSTSELTGVGAVYVRHTAACIRKAAAG